VLDPAKLRTVASGRRPGVGCERRGRLKRVRNSGMRRRDVWMGAGGGGGGIRRPAEPGPEPESVLGRGRLRAIARRSGRTRRIASHGPGHDRATNGTALPRHPQAWHAGVAARASHSAWAVDRRASRPCSAVVLCPGETREGLSDNVRVIALEQRAARCRPGHRGKGESGRASVERRTPRSPTYQRAEREAFMACRRTPMCVLPGSCQVQRLSNPPPGRNVNVAS